MNARGLEHLPDGDLLFLIAAREADALEVVYDRHITPVWKLALLTCGNVAAAEQAVFETFMNLWRQPRPNDTAPLVVRLLSYLQTRDIANPSRSRSARFALGRSPSP